MYIVIFVFHFIYVFNFYVLLWLFCAIAQAKRDGNICVGDGTELNDNTECVRGRSKGDMVPHCSHLPPWICWS